MWSKVVSHKLIATSIKPEQIWQVWTAVENWHIWQNDIESATIRGRFEQGSIIKLKLQNGSIIKMELRDVQVNKQFTDLTRFFLAKMYAIHEFIVDGNNLELRDTFKISGPLSFIWRKLLLEKVVNSDYHQTQKLIERVLELNGESYAK